MKRSSQLLSIFFIILCFNYSVQLHGKELSLKVPAFLPPKSSGLKLGDTTLVCPDCKEIKVLTKEIQDIVHLLAKGAPKTYREVLLFQALGIKLPKDLLCNIYKEAKLEQQKSVLGPGIKMANQFNIAAKGIEKYFKLKDGGYGFRKFYLFKFDDEQRAMPLAHNETNHISVGAWYNNGTIKIFSGNFVTSNLSHIIKTSIEVNKEKSIGLKTSYLFKEAPLPIEVSAYTKYSFQETSYGGRLNFKLFEGVTFFLFGEGVQKHK